MKEIELMTTEEIDEFIAKVQNYREKNGNRMKDIQVGNLSKRVSELEQEIHDYVINHKDNFDPDHFAMLNTEYFNLRFRLDSKRGKC